MTRQEFEEALIPLTSDEQSQKSNPYIDKDFYATLTHNKKSVDLEAKQLIKQYVFFYDCNILPDRTGPENYKSQDIAFNRNGRFSDIPMHSHGYIEMNYVFSGNASAKINDKVIALSTGDLCIMDCDVLHTILPTGEEDIILNIMLSTEYFSNSFLTTLLNGGPVAKFLAGVMTEKNNHNQYLLFHTARSSLAKELIENMILEYLNPGICCKDVLYFNLNLLFIELARCYQEHMERKKQKKSKPYLTEILTYMENHCTDCTLNEAAKQFNFSPKYLSRMLKEETGANFQDILCECRMKRAGFLLSNSDLPIYKIANECGYLNQSFFRQKFMVHYGLSPAEYRKGTVS